MIKPDVPEWLPKPTTVSHYAMAVLSVAIAIVAADLATRLLYAEAIASSMLCGVIFTAWFGGFEPALLAIALALLAFHYYLVPPINSFTWKHDFLVVSLSEVPRLFLFSITSLIVAFVISAQRKAAEELRRSTDDLRVAMERFRDYAETASDWFWETGPDHRFIRVSEQLASVGISPTLRVGAARWDFATDLNEEPEKWRRHVATLEGHEPFHNFRYSTTRGDGSVLHIAISGRPVFDLEGQFLGYRGVTRDVTAEVRAEHAENALQQARAELAREARLMTGDAVAAAMAHEIKQPLSAMVTGADAAVHWLDRSMPEIDEAKAALKGIAVNGHRVGAVIGSIRGMFKSDARNRTPLDVNELISEAITLLRSDLQKHRISVQTDTNRQARPVIGDRIQLQQVLLNLIANAIDAMAGDDEPRILSVRSEVSDNRTMVAVADSGKGIASQDVGRIFNPLFTTKTQGMGMGLSICRSIIEAHGGQIWVTTNKGRGAIFHFTLPVDPGSPS
jgi:PAS domain S-box-containing protein